MIGAASVGAGMALTGQNSEPVVKQGTNNWAQIKALIVCLPDRQAGL
jgi:hypothetical protein